MSETQPNPTALSEIFSEELTALESATEDHREGIFRALGLIATTAILTESETGMSAESELGNITEQLKSAVHKFSGDAISGRLLGLHDITFQATGMLPPQIDDTVYETLQRLGKEPITKAEAYRVPSNLIRVRSFGDQVSIDITPRGQAALEAYQRRQAKVISNQ